MSDSDSEKVSEESSDGTKVFKRKGFQFLGIGWQDCIRYFFGGNASLAIVILILICVFLLKEAVMFFPQHHEDLKMYRHAGQEFVDYVGEEIDAHTRLYSASNIAYFAEINESSVEEDTKLRSYRSVLAAVEKAASKSWKRLDRFVDEADDIRDDIEDLESDLEEASAAQAETDADAADAADAADVADAAPSDAAEEANTEEIENELAGLQERLAVLDGRIESERVSLKEQVTAAIDLDATWRLGAGVKAPEGEVREKIREAVLFEAYPDAEDEHPYITELKEGSKAKKAAAAEELVDFKATIKGMQDAARPIKAMHSEIRSIASDNKRVLVSYSTAHARKAALLKGSEVAATPEDRARMKEQAEAVVIEEPDLDGMNAPLYEFIPEHTKLAGELAVAMDKLYAELPTKNDVATKSAKENLERAKTLFKRLENKLDKNPDEFADWRHDARLSVPETVSAFLFGRDWITNSSWHDFYGLLPIFTGSFMIAMIALSVAVPFGVLAAVYVNQLASHKEQNMVKPAIEFIEAIPSVVLGFFGILVFGETLRNISQVEWLEWVPGFPMTERLTILNAGLLLAFMAVPTIFTLTEDALQNVPSAFTENSLAMGASKLQTVFRVILPTALSGIIAAILLGFGRIIGETMVVLLVAGNKIKIPDFTEGLGVIAQPTHTMTGIIAQELGEVDSGSLHWRALFMVGMVLFVISLLVNWAAQKVVKKFHKI